MSCRKCGCATSRRLCRQCELDERYQEEAHNSMGQSVLDEIAADLEEDDDE